MTNGGRDLAGRDFLVCVLLCIVLFDKNSGQRLICMIDKGLREGGGLL